MAKSINAVVTINGILLSKSGTMTGGLSGGMEARSNKWDESTIEGMYSLSNLLVLIFSFFFHNVCLVLKFSLFYPNVWPVGLALHSL